MALSQLLLTKCEHINSSTLPHAKNLLKSISTRKIKKKNRKTMQNTLHLKTGKSKRMQIKIVLPSSYYQNCRNSHKKQDGSKIYDKKYISPFTHANTT